MPTSYHYNNFPPDLKLDKEISSLINQARTELGRYDGFLSSMIDNQALLSPLFTQEAVLSSRIEGTQSTLTEVLEFEAGENKNLSKNKKDDLAEVLNYRYALNAAIKLIKENTPLSSRMLKAMHKELMQGVRGKNKSPGEYRKMAVWLGSDDIKTARFIPIEAQKIPDAMSIFEKYLHENDDYDDLIKIALLHVEFESIHPFLDGNGRLGRLFIPLYLTEKKLLESPYFYISSYFEKNKDIYYELLLNVSKNNDWLAWCKFFIKGILEQAQDNLKLAQQITNYYNQLKVQLPTLTKSQYGITALDFIFKNNYFSSKYFYKKANIPSSTAQRLLEIFKKQEILYCAHGTGRKPNFYVFRKLIAIADGENA